MNFEKLFIGLSLFLALSMGTYFLYLYSPMIWTPPDSGEGFNVTAAEILFIVISWLIFLLGVQMRLLNLISLLTGQIGLLYIPWPLVSFGYELPNYALIGINGFYMLILYFAFSTEKWAPYSVEDELEEM